MGDGDHEAVVSSGKSLREEKGEKKKEEKGNEGKERTHPGTYGRHNSTFCN